MYDVGQVLYVILSKKHTILPVRVTEQIVRRTVEGESISYKVLVPGRNQTVSLASLGKVHYSSIEDVKRELLSNAENAISSMAEKAKSIAKEFFQAAEESEASVVIPKLTSPKSLGEDPAKVDLGGGVLANVDLSSIGAIGGESE